MLRGEAELHFPQVVEDQLEEVHVKLRGSIHTYVVFCNMFVRLLTFKMRIVQENQSSSW